MAKTKQPTLRQQIKAFQDSKEFIGDKFFYFFDWFCKETSLKNKAMSLMPKVIKFAEVMNIDLDAHNVIFKNNCPVFGSLYDDFRICHIKDEEVVWTVTPKTGHRVEDGMLSQVWGRINNFEEPVHTAENWKTLLTTIKP